MCDVIGCFAQLDKLLPVFFFSTGGQKRCSTCLQFCTKQASSSSNESLSYVYSSFNSYVSIQFVCIRQVYYISVFHVLQCDNGPDWDYALTRKKM